MRKTYESLSNRMKNHFQFLILMIQGRIRLRVGILSHKLYSNISVTGLTGSNNLKNFFKEGDIKKYRAIETNYHNMQGSPPTLLKKKGLSAILEEGA